MKARMIPYTATPLRDDKLLSEQKEVAFKIGDKTVFVPLDLLSKDQLDTITRAFISDPAAPRASMTIELPETFVRANGLPLPTPENGANIHGIGPDTAAGPNPDYKPPLADTVSSISDARTVNNVMRHEYRVLNDLEKAHMKEVKDIGADFLDKLREIEPKGSRELSIARTKMEEAVMWAVKHITA